ncbi:MAG: flagellar basal body P-ring formation protein FlgA [Verrucomicrobiae bacterium]|nr:flagellar basal body P-ring formation protein FlgA [Verrucomicrobiae bacterium]
MNHKFYIAIKFIIAAALVLPSGSTCLTASNASGSQITLDQILRPLQTPSETEMEITADQISENSTDAETYTFIAKSDILAKLTQSINATLDNGDRVQISSRAEIRPIKIPKGANWSVYAEDNFSPDTKGNWFPLIKIVVNSHLQESHRLPLIVALFRPVYMATYRLDRGTPLKPPSVKSVICDIYDHRGNPIPASFDLNDYELVQGVPEGRLISWSDVARRPDVRRGDMVDVVLRNGGLSISLVAMALDNGVMGQSVSLRNVRSRHEFAGIVTGSKQVEIKQ